MMMKKRWCAQIREEEEDQELGSNQMKKIIKQQCSSLIQIKSSASWSDLELDMLREMNRKLSYADRIRFRGVCRSWRASGREKRVGDVRPWLMSLSLNLEKRLDYRLYEPLSLDPIKFNTSAIISGTINVGDYFQDLPTIISYADGWVSISIYNYKPKSFGFLFFSVATRALFTLPEIKAPKFPMYLALSATPDCPDCVFLALHFDNNEDTRTISIFRHGDTQWTTTRCVGRYFPRPKNDAVVFIHGVFYFFLTVGIGSYDIATGLLDVDRYSTALEFDQIYRFFGLDGDLMLAYNEKETLKFCIRKYDWSNKVWVPLQSLSGRSMYLSRHSVYVDQINYYGTSSANKIYIRVMNEPSHVDEYSLEDGQLSPCPSERLKSLGGPERRLDIWVCPPDVLLRK